MATYYVTQDGAGAADGSTVDDPLSVAGHNAHGGGFAAGSIIYLMDTITTGVVAPSSGSSGNPIEYRGDYTGRPCTISVPAGTGLTPSKNYLKVHDITITGCQTGVTGTNNTAIGFVDNEIYNLRISNCSVHGIYFLAGDSLVTSSLVAISGLKIHDCTVTDCGRYGIAVTGRCSNVDIYNNVVTNCSTEAASIYWGIYTAPKHRDLLSDSSWTSSGDVWTINIYTEFAITNERVDHVVTKAASGYYWLTAGTYGSLSAGEWAHEAASGNVQVHLGGSNATETSIYLCMTAHAGVTIRDNIVSGVQGTDGIGLGADVGATQSNILRNKSYNNDGFGIDLNICDNMKVHGNIVYENGTTLTRDGISVQFPGPNGVTVYNNTCKDNARHGCRINSGGTDLVTLKNNIWQGGTTDIETIGASTTYVESHNCSYDVTTTNCSTNVVTSDPGLGTNYTPGSNVIGHGTWLAGVKAYDDLPLPLHPDIGAVQNRDAAGRKFGVGGGAL